MGQPGLQRRETMATSKESLVHALENSVFEFPELPGRWEVPSFWGVRAHATPQTAHPIGNLIGVATLTEKNQRSAKKLMQHSADGRYDHRQIHHRLGGDDHGIP